MDRHYFTILFQSHIHLHPPDATVSLLNLGGLLVACIPGETTVMAGRRIHEVLDKVMVSKDHKPRIVVSGSTNEYIYFITTYEEYFTYTGVSIFNSRCEKERFFGCTVILYSVYPSSKNGPCNPLQLYNNLYHIVYAPPLTSPLLQSHIRHHYTPAKPILGS